MASSGRRRWFGIGWLASCACACAQGAARGDDVPPSPGASQVAPPALPALPAGGDAARGQVIGEIDGLPILASDAFRLVQLSAPGEAASAVRQLAIDRLAAIEAARAGATVPPAIVERELANMLATQERKVREQSAGKRDLAAFVKSTYGLEPPEYFAIVRASLERSLLLERVVLIELARHPRMQVRLIRVKDAKLAEEIRTKIGQGADFAALAKQHSEDGSAREGGVYPPLPSDLSSPLFEKCGSLDAGALSDVEEVSTPDGPRYRIVQVLARLPAERGDGRQVAESIEKLLEARPLAPLELEAWMRIMEERHQIRMFGLSGPPAPAGAGTDDEGA